jgi:uncharacterized protein (TIGR02680 family)
MNDTRSAVLPAATRTDRWQPIRCGLLNLYRFDDEVFIFERGRLLLRGNNGTGKSRVLALTLPFLLEGEVASHRVEPDSDPAKKMEWNLLMGRHSDRLGYTWIEFGRKFPAGGAEYVTLGCGLKAAEGRGLIAHWFFITTQRVGNGFFLAENRTAHSKARLEQAIGTAGKVFTKASDYRQAVDAKLFGLGTQYEAMLNLLVQLRQPQLTRKFDEELVSNTLSDALPPLSEKLLGEVAEAFRNLQTEEDALANVKAAHDGVEAFLREYRRYVQIAARRRAGHLLAANREHNGVVKRQKQHESEKERAEQALAEIKVQTGKLIALEDEFTAKIQALTDSPEMRSAEQLEDARKAADEAEQFAKTSAEDVATAEGRGTRAAEEFGQQQTVAKEALAETQRKVESACNDARAAGLEAEHASAVDTLKWDALENASPIKTAEQRLWEATQRRLTSIGHLEKLEATVADTHVALKQAQQAQTEVESQLAAATEEQTRKHRDMERATDALLLAYRNWTRNLTELKPTDAERFEELFTSWVETGEGENPVSEIVEEALRQTERLIIKSRSEAEHRQGEIGKTIVQLETERTALRDGHHRPPMPPTTRDPLSRTARAGAPLWALCDFRDELSAPDRAGIEAALEASGLLDAWVTPNGCLLNPNDLDTIIVTGISPPAPVGKALAQVLRPEPSAVVPIETVQALLSHIGLGEGAGHAWVDTRGCWQLGPLRGMWRKAAAQHLGASARETERLRQIAEVEVRLGTAQAEKALVYAEIAALDARSQTARNEGTAAPRDDAVRQAIAERNSATGQVNQLHRRVEAAEKTVRESRTTWNIAVQKRDADARDVGLEDWVGKLSQIKDGVHHYRTTLAGLWPSLHNLVSARMQCKGSEQRLAESRADIDQKAQALQAARRKHAGLKTRYETLHSSVGATVQQMHADIAKLEKKLAGVREEKQVQETALLDENKKLAVAENNLEQAGHELQRTEEERSIAVSALHAFGRVRLLGVAHDDFRDAETLDWTIKGALEIARRLESSLGQIASADDDWKRNQDAIYSHIEELKRTLLQCEFTPEPTATEDGIFIVNVPFQGRACTMVELREALASDITTRQMLLDAREREVIEKYLLDEAASELHTRLREGEEWVRKANDELTARPMGTGMALRFDWQPRDDGPSGLAAARKQLLRLNSTWSPSERAALSEFLQDQIRLVRQNNATGGWQQHLAEALDYRRWHRFAILQRRERDGEWKRLTKRTHGTGSGGEKAVALTLPQFAAAAAHYRGAPLAPRLILLDEAFVGVDSDMRRKCMDLLTIFDLDLVMTSEREWGCYPTVPALAIYQLSRRDGIDAVGISRWVWNGKKCASDASPVVTASAPELRPVEATELKLDGL